MPHSLEEFRNAEFPALLVLCAFWLAAWASRRQHLLSRSALVLILAAPWVLFLVLVYVIRGWSLVYPAMLNPDEAQLIAEAIKIAHGSVIPWADYDMLTVGPLEPLLAAPLVAIAPTQPYLAMRIAIIAVAVTVAMATAVLAWQRVRWGVAQALGAAVLAVLLLPSPADLFSYSTELVPLLLLVLGACCVLRGFVGTRRVSVRAATITTVIGFLLIGMIPLAKLQVAPVAGCVVLAYILVSNRIAWRRRIALLTPIALPSFVAAALIALSSRTRAAFIDSTQFVLQYSNGQIFRKQPYEVVVRDFMSGVLEPLLMFNVLVLLGLLLVAVRRWRTGSRDEAGIAALALMGPMGFAAIVYTGMGFPHHIIVALYPTVVGVVVGAAFLSRWLPSRSRCLFVPCIACVLVAVVVIRPAVMGPGVVASAPLFINDLPALKAGASPALIAYLDSCPPEIAVWGWDPGVLVISGKSHTGPWSALVSRDVPQSAAWLANVAALRPECILDATGPGQFAFGAPEDALARQPGMSPLLAGYTEVLHEPAYRGYRRGGQ